MGAPTLENLHGVLEASCSPGTGLRGRCYTALLRNNSEIIAVIQAVGGVAGADVTEFALLSLTTARRLEYPSTLVAQLVQTAPAPGTMRIRVRGFDQFGEVIEELTPIIAITNKTNNFIYLAKVFVSILEVAYISTGIDIATSFMGVGIRWDWTRTDDSTSQHHAGTNLGWGFPLWLQKFPTGTVQNPYNLRINKDPTGPANVYAGNTLTVAEIAGVQATQILTTTGSFANNETIVIGTVTYTLKTGAGALAAYEVRIAAGAASVDIATIQKAINQTGTATVDYGLGMVAHPLVECSAITATTLTVRARTAGTFGNTIATTETCANASWSGVTLGVGSGVAGVDYVGISNAETVTIGGKVYTWKTVLTAADGDVLIGATVADSLSNLRAAINLSTGAGTVYGLNMVVNASVIATNSTATTLVVRAKEPGSRGNLITVAEAMARGFWDASSLLRLFGGISDHREVMGVTTRIISPTNLPTDVVPADFEVGLGEVNWDTSLEKIALTRAAAVPTWNQQFVASGGGHAVGTTNTAGLVAGALVGQRISMLSGVNVNLSNVITANTATAITHAVFPGANSDGDRFEILVGVLVNTRLRSED